MPVLWFILQKLPYFRVERVSSVVSLTPLASLPNSPDPDDTHSKGLFHACCVNQHVPSNKCKNTSQNELRSTVLACFFSLMPLGL